VVKHILGKEYGWSADVVDNTVAVNIDRSLTLIMLDKEREKEQAEKARKNR